MIKILVSANVSTHSRLKAAGYAGGNDNRARDVSTHSRLKAAGTGFMYSSGFN